MVLWQQMNHVTRKLIFGSCDQVRPKLVCSATEAEILTVESIGAASSEFGTYRLCEQRRFRWACASVQSRQNLCCLFIQAVSQEEPSDRKPDRCPLWMAGHVQLKFVMTECSKTQIRLTRHIGIVVSTGQMTKMLIRIRLRRYAGWSASLLFAYGIINRFCHGVAQINAVGHLSDGFISKVMAQS